jgi:DNA repair protein RadC
MTAYLNPQQQDLIQRALRVMESSAPSFTEYMLQCGHAKSYFRLRLGLRECEYFSVAFLDTQHRLLHVEDMFRGTINSASIHIREVVKDALKHNAAAVIFGHNHPSGECRPSQADIRITKSLREALALIDVVVLDHIVVCANDSYSFVEHHVEF